MTFCGKKAKGVRRPFVWGLSVFSCACALLFGAITIEASIPALADPLPTQGSVILAESAERVEQEAPVAKVDTGQTDSTSSESADPISDDGVNPGPLAQTNALASSVKVQIYQDGVGWLAPEASGASALGSGNDYAMQIVRLSLEGMPQGYGFDSASATNIDEESGIAYRVCQGLAKDGGWGAWAANGADAGSLGKSITAIEIKLTGAVAKTHDLYYRVFLPKGRSLAWVHSGEASGCPDSGFALESIQVRLVPKGARPKLEASRLQKATVGMPSLSMRVTQGDLGEQSASGLAFQNGRLGNPFTDLAATVSSADGLTGDIRYWVRNASGKRYFGVNGSKTANNAFYPIERITFELTGDIAECCDLWYRTHVTGLGWTGFAKEGQVSGITPQNLAIDAVEIHIVAGGQPAPGSTANTCFTSVRGYDCGPTTAKGKQIAQMCFTQKSPGSGLCAMWVSQVIYRATGAYPGGNANDMYYRVHETDRSKLRAGMIVGVPTHSHTRAGSLYGHVCLYIGNGLIMDNVGSIRTVTLDGWDRYYSDRKPVHFGWL